jgi:excisionase family DNA binding protein
VSVMSIMSCHVYKSTAEDLFSQTNSSYARIGPIWSGLRMDTLLSVDEAARRLGGLSKYTIHAWLSSGKLRRTKVGSRTMIRESELERVIEDGGKSPAARSQGQERR